MTTFTIDFLLCFIFILLSLFSLFYLSTFFFKKPKNSLHEDCSLPPSPPSLPIIGHLHLILSLPFHKAFHKLSSKYGPLLHLHVFNIPIIIVSSGSMAYEILRTNDQNFPTRDRLTPLMEKSLLFGSYSIVTAPCGDYWRFMKKLVVTKLLGTQALEGTRLIREEEVKTFRAMLFDKAAKNEAIDVGKEMMKVTNNILCRMIMGRRCSEENGEAEQVRGLVTKSISLTGKLLVANTIGRLLKKLIGISLFEKDMMEVSMKFDELFEKIIKEHEENPNKKEDKDMMDVVLEVCADQSAGFEITRNHIKSLFVELSIAGTDALAQTTQWTMSELINNPEVLKRLREEIESVVGKRLMQESDLTNLPFLQVVVKEGLRLHPPSPIVLRNATEGCKIGGYYIPENSTMIINTYAVMRDPNSWEDPNEFQPQRFLVSPSKGQVDEKEYLTLKYIPFGSGRRGCPGSHLGYSFAGVAIGTMVQCFDWKINSDKVNMEETGDLTLIKAHPLMCTPVARIDPLASFASSNL